VVADAGYGNDSKFRDGVMALGLRYVVGIQTSLLLWKEDAVRPPPGRRGGKPSHEALREQQISVKELALELPAEAWQAITWRVMDDPLTSRFARLRVRPAVRGEMADEEWLLIEWPEDEPEPTKYWLSTLPADIGIETMVDRAKLRWRIERDYQDLKQELGLGHYEGRGWRGLHHHITLCIAAYGFLIAERAAVPPSGPRNQGRPEAAIVPAGHRSRGPAIATGAAYPKLHHDTQTPAYRRPGRASAEMPVLRKWEDGTGPTEFMTQ
jgi:SRSO17 transposase